MKQSKDTDKPVELSQKQNNVFKGLSKFFETRNYKKGLKAVDKLLEETPKHAESIAMRALFYLYIGDENKALLEGKRAVMESKMKSQLCWQNYGLILRMKRDYNQALVAYKNAQARAQQLGDGNNMAILREVSNLQAQSRDFQGLCETRYEILKQKSNAINNWLGLALAFHLKGEHSETLRTLKSADLLMQTIELKPPQKSNFNIYKCLVYRDAGNYDEFYKQLKEKESLILDKIVLKELLVDACIHLKKGEEAENLANQLITEFPENSDYFLLLQKVREMGNAPSDLLNFYSEIADRFKSRMASLLELSNIRDETLFKLKFLTFILPAIKKSIVSIFSEISILYNDPMAHKWIGDTLLQLEDSLRNGIYTNGDSMVSPAEFLWALYIRSQHLSLNFDTLPQALMLINEAISHTPTLVQLYVVKAHILQKQHDHCESIRAINEARQLDLSDRYMNNICIKHMLRAMRPEMAETVMRAFMGSESTAYELQNMWYEIQMGRCYLHRGEYGPGLRHIHFVQKQFEDMYEDQYDFHSYALYRWSLKEYLDLVRYGDDIFNDRKYMEAAGIAIKYLMNYAQIKAELAPPKESPHQPPNIDYNGAEYLKNLGDPHQEALRWAKNVASAQYLNKNNQKINSIFFRAFGQALKLFIRLGKPMLALKTLRKLLKTNVDPTVTHLYRLTALLYFEKAITQDINPITKDILKNALVDLLSGSQGAKEYNEKVTATWVKSIETKLRVEESKLILAESPREEWVALYQREIQQKDMPLKDVLRLVHKLEFYRKVDTELKVNLNERYGAETTYFTDWNAKIDEVRKEEWIDWWNERWPYSPDEVSEEKKSNLENKPEESKQL